MLIFTRMPIQRGCLLQLSTCSHLNCTSVSQTRALSSSCRRCGMYRDSINGMCSWHELTKLVLVWSWSVPLHCLCFFTDALLCDCGQSECGERTWRRCEHSGIALWDLKPRTSGVPSPTWALFSRLVPFRSSQAKIFLQHKALVCLLFSYWRWSYCKLL